MKFEVCRASNILPTEEEKPCEEATLDHVANRMGIFTVEIENLEALIVFCGKYGDVVIEKREPLPILLIYDSYIE